MRRTRKRGGNRPLPLQYFGAAAPVSASAGGDRLDVTENMVRSAIGGKRRMSGITCKSMKKRGGFYPSVMGNFVEAASNYITPLALFAAYKLMNRPSSKRSTSKRSTSKRSTSKRSTRK